MARYVLKIGCSCANPVCRRAIHGLAASGRRKLRLVMTDDGHELGDIRLTKKEGEILGRWLLDMPKPYLGRKMKQGSDIVPWIIP